MDRNNLFVRINYRTKDEYNNIEDIKSEHGTKIRNGELNATKYLIGGGVYNRKGGTVVFNAKNLEEVKQVTTEKPLIKDTLMRYDVVVIPKAI